MNELWIPILGVICAVGMPVLLGIIASYMTIKSKHEEKMAMIEKGIVLEEAMRPERRPNRYNTLRNGIFMIGLSLGVIVGMMLDSAFTYDSDWFFLLVPAITIMVRFGRAKCEGCQKRKGRIAVRYDNGGGLEAYRLCAGLRIAGRCSGSLWTSFCRRCRYLFYLQPERRDD